MYPSMDLKKLEIWLTDKSDMEYNYGYVRDEDETIDLSIAKKAMEKFATTKSTGANTELQVDIIGGEPTLEFDMIKKLQEQKESLENGNGKTLKLRVMTSGILSQDQKTYIPKKKIFLRNRLTSMEPTDEWWYGIKDDSDTLSPTLNTKVTKIKETFPEFHHRLIVSRNNPAFKDRVENLMEDGVENIFMIPKLINECSLEDTPNLRESMDEYGNWFKAKLLENIIPPVVNSKRLLYMIHRFQEGNPVQVKNRCNNTYERVTLVPDGIFRTCRHSHVYPKWTLGNISDGFYDPRRKNLYRYGLIMKGGCRKCVGRFYCAGPCISIASVYADNEYFPMGYHCLFIKLHTEIMEYIYNTLKIENPDVLEQTLNNLNIQM